ncbi:sugar O-acetyltransferase [Paucilactobacillus suebicus]|uniref:Acetyltransferase n=1 Tax=Paucilactobacillus suebicus DSM 5007 = KCTC 3549 TaxID=1423807 RepID=A0A0R1VVA1_9LACO|nr:sugar O-acetyltransferase [Paucilactobacillus suebicus]KRM09343.1 acetyltransferase [Paucilactobacillus suebicus DSM 5007 = KCTC 3549]
MNLSEKFDYMAKQVPYNDLDPLLVDARARSTKLTTELNSSNNNDEKKRILSHLLGSSGVNPFFEPFFRCEFGCNIHIGDNFYANYDCVMLDGAPINIGDNVLFGPKAGLYTSNHLIDAKERRQGGCIAKPISIGDDVWFGANVTVMPGVTIGDRTIIGGGSVVTKNIPSDVIAVDNPCHVMRKITDEDRTGFDGTDKFG